MATQVLIPEQASESTSASPGPGPRYTNLRRSFGILAFFAVVAAIEALVPKLRFLLFQLPFFVAPALVSAVFNYLRDFHPALVPKMLDADSTQLLKLKRVRKALLWTSFATVVAGLVALVATSCTCEEHPVLFIVWLASTFASFTGYVGLSAYILLRSAPSPIQRARSWPAPPRPISEYKPFHSDHWGEPVRPFPDR